MPLHCLDSRVHCCRSCCCCSCWCLLNLQYDAVAGGRSSFERPEKWMAMCCQVGASVLQRPVTSCMLRSCNAGPSSAARPVHSHHCTPAAAKLNAQEGGKLARAWLARQAGRRHLLHRLMWRRQVALPSNRRQHRHPQRRQHRQQRSKRKQVALGSSHSNPNGCSRIQSRCCPTGRGSTAASTAAERSRHH